MSAQGRRQLERFQFSLHTQPVVVSFCQAKVVLQNAAHLGGERLVFRAALVRRFQNRISIATFCDHDRSRGSKQPKLRRKCFGSCLGADHRRQAGTRQLKILRVEFDAKIPATLFQGYLPCGSTAVEWVKYDVARTASGENARLN